MRVVKPFQTGAGQGPFWQSAARPSVLIFLLSLLAGTVVVAWQTHTQALSARAAARTMAIAAATSVEGRLNSALQTTARFGALAQSDSSLLTNFQQVGTGLLGSEPALVSLELEPGGVVSEVVPRAAHSRAIIGLNVFRSSAQAAAARAALQNHSLTLAGPFTLQNDQPGLIARMPLFQIGRGGQSSFWGFVAGSIGFAAALRAAGMDGLVTRGYDYRLYAARPGQSGVTVAAHGSFSLEDAMEQAVQIQGADLRLALRPRSGWFNWSQVLFESVAVLAFSGLLYLLASHGEHRLTAMETELASARQGQSRWEHQKNQFEASVRQAQESEAFAQGRSRQAESELSRLRSELDSRTRAAAEAAQGHQAELERNRLALEREHREVEHLQARLAEFADAQRKAAAVYEDRSGRDKAAIGDLERRLQDANRLARETSEASAGRLKSLERDNEELKRRLHQAEQNAAKASESTAPRQQTQSQLEPSEAADAAAHGPSGQAEPLALEDGASAGSAVVPHHPPTEQRPRSRPLKVKKSRSARDNQIDLFAESGEAPTDSGGSTPGEASPTAALDAVAGRAVAGGSQRETQVQPRENERGPRAREGATPHRSEELGSVDLPEFRRAVNEMLPLLAEQDPGAQDCLGGNRAVFRSAFTAEAFAEFERAISSRNFGPALEQLRRCARKHGLPA